ncbi:putative ribonuclease H-like domain-containing protein [Tanacetum coccineum]|uniref:Ribonuclease H-like domain-containing protein n=1 Tax=Tanacetum coccineum TaxID=301880 RepID=A0ABQ5GRQ0_9ASTR
MSGEEPATQIEPVEYPQMVSTVKLPILKKGEYTLWSMRMEQFSLTHIIVYANQKFLRALPSSWNNVALIMRNKAGIDDLDINDLYNNLKVFEADIKGSSISSSNSQNVAFLSAEDTSSNNEPISPTTINEELEQIDHDDLEEMDLKCMLAQDEPTEFALMAYTSNSSGSDTEPTLNKDSASVSQVETSTSQTSNTSVEMPRVESLRPSGVIMEDWVSDDKDIFKSNDLQATDNPSLKRIEFTNARNKSVKPKQADKLRIIAQNPKVDRKDWNGQMTQKLGLGFGFTNKSRCFVCAVNKDTNKKRMDVKSAFLYGTIEEEVYVSQPLAWYETLSTYLLDNGFHKGKIDKTLFIKRVKGDILLVQVYVYDIIFGSTRKSLCTDFEQIIHKRFQISSIGGLTFFLSLQVKQKNDGIFISQDKIVGENLKKFAFLLRTASTPMETNKALTKDEDGEDVDVHLYRSMIGSLMYLTSSRPDIMFSVCACSRFQVQPKVSHLNAVKRIFRYLKGQPKLGLWYPKDSPFILEAFSDSDYAGASLDKKSTTGGCQFLGSRLISWQCKKQTVVANSTTEAEYIAASHCCGQVLWIQNQMLDYGFNFMQTKIHVDNESAICVVKNPVSHSKTKHIEIMHHFIRDSYEKRLIEMVKIHTDNNVADLLTKAFDVSRFNFLVASIGKRGRDTKIPQSGGPPIKVGDEAVHKELGDIMERAATTASSFETDQDCVTSTMPSLNVQPYISLIEQFWQTAALSTTKDGVHAITPTIDGRDKIITQASIRRHLKLQDSKGLTSLPNVEIFEQLARMGYATTSDTLTFQKGHFAPQ